MKLRHLEAHMRTAKNYADLSHAKRLKVGCLFLRDDSILSYSWNGTRPGFHNACEDENNVTLPTVRHAERNALDKFIRSAETAEGCTVVLTHWPCLNCAIDMVTSKIKEVIFESEYRDDAGIRYLYENEVPVFKLKEERLYKMYINEEDGCISWL